MAGASKIEQKKEEKQKMDVVKKEGNLGEKLDEVTKRDETRAEAGMEHAGGKKHRKNGRRKYRII
jgi:hypothetical protein